MFGIRYLKADPTTHVIKMVNGEIKEQGAGLAFYYFAPTTSIIAIPVNTQEVPFIFSEQTEDFQCVTLQGQLTYRIAQPEETAKMINFTLADDGVRYVSEDPTRLNDRVLKAAQVIVRDAVKGVNLYAALRLAKPLTAQLLSELKDDHPMLVALGIDVLQVSIANVAPTPETARALEAEAREAILKKADDAIYSRRKSAVEQERMIKQEELKTELSVQDKEREIEEARIEGERATQHQRAVMAQEQLQADIDAEDKRKAFVELAAANRIKDADAQAYATTAQMKALATLPVDNLKAMALAGMSPEQLMAQAMDNIAQNAGKIGELNISPDLLGQLVRRAI